jgi:hypothetical protein
MGREVEQALLRQDAQGLAQRDAAGARAQDKLRLDQPRAWREAPLQDLLPQPVGQAVGEGLRAGKGLGGGNFGGSQDC